MNDCLVFNGSLQTALGRTSFQRYNLHRIKVSGVATAVGLAGMFKSRVLPAMLYGSAFVPFADPVIRKLNSFQYQMGATILGVPPRWPERFVTLELGWKPVVAYCQGDLLNFLAHVARLPQTSLPRVIFMAGLQRALLHPPPAKGVNAARNRFWSQLTTAANQYGIDLGKVVRNDRDYVDAKFAQNMKDAVSRYWAQKLRHDASVRQSTRLYAEVVHADTHLCIQPYLKTITNLRDVSSVALIRSRWFPEAGRQHDYKYDDARLCVLCQRSIGTARHLLRECAVLEPERRRVWPLCFGHLQPEIQDRLWVDARWFMSGCDGNCDAGSKTLAAAVVTACARFATLLILRRGEIVVEGGLMPR